MAVIDVAHCYRFGRFVLEPERRTLRAGDAPVSIGARAFDILSLLVRHHDRVVTKDEILANVWRGTIVEENNLAVHVSALRKALGEKPGGDRFIATVSGLGYRFVGTIDDAAADDRAPARAPAMPRPEPPPPARPPAMARPAAIRRLALAVAGVLVLFATAAVWLLPAAPTTAPRLSIAVLPFSDLGGGPRDYLADAITDDLTSDLSHLAHSVVIARDSADVFRGRALSAASVGRALRVRYLMEGSLLDDGRSLHVNAQLVDAAADRQLWASVFDVPRADLSGSLTDIVRRISNSLRTTLVQAEATHFQLRPAANPDALDYYLHAKSVLDRSDGFASVTTAQHLLEQAAQAAPADGDVLAELGLLLVHKIGDFDDVDEFADHSRAKAVIRQALDLAPQDPLAVTASGMLAWLEFRCGEAEAKFQLALSLDPNDIRARNGLAVCARELGKMDEMISQFREILRIDPVGPGKAEIENSIGMGYLMLGKPAVAKDWLERSGADLGVADDAAPASGWQEHRRLFLIAATRLSGDPAGAVRLYREFRQSHPHRTVFQMSQYESRAVGQLSGNKAFLGALEAAGMPRYPPEDEDFGVKPADRPQAGDDFAPTPLAIPGGQRISTAAVHALLSGTDRPLMIDISGGATAIPGAIWVSSDDAAIDFDRIAREENAGRSASLDRPVIAASWGSFGWQSYDAALSLIHHGYRHVFWYRGGEAAWVAAGYPTQDRRPS